MKRGEIWTAAAGSGYGGKPRPVVIVQDDRFDQTASITLCPFTTEECYSAFVRLPVTPSADNGLATPSFVMVDKIVTVPRAKLGRRLGHLDAPDLLRLDTAMLAFLGLAP